MHFKINIVVASKGQKTLCWVNQYVNREKDSAEGNTSNLCFLKSCLLIYFKNLQILCSYYTSFVLIYEANETFFFKWTPNQN